MAKKLLAFALSLFSVMAFADIKDPTRPADFTGSAVTEVGEEAASFTVSTILKRKTASWVIINDQKVSERQSVDGASVLKIEANRVLLSVNGEQRWLSLSEQNSGLKKRLGE